MTQEELNYTLYVGWNALHRAARWGREQIVAMLLSRGAVLEARSGYGGGWGSLPHTHKLVWANSLASRSTPGQARGLLAADRQRGRPARERHLPKPLCPLSLRRGCIPPPRPLGQGAARGGAQGCLARWLPPFAGAAAQDRELGETLAPDERGDGLRAPADGREEGPSSRPRPCPRVNREKEEQRQEQGHARSPSHILEQALRGRFECPGRTGSLADEG